jgi:hypothetical protein
MIDYEYVELTSPNKTITHNATPKLTDNVKLPKILKAGDADDRDNSDRYEQNFESFE